MGNDESISRTRDLFKDHGAKLVIGVVGLLLLVDMIRQLATGDLTFARLLTYLWEGLVIGLSIGLAGIGLSMTYSILNFANFSHGDYLTAGAFSGWATTWLLAGLSAEVGLGKLFLLTSGVSTRELGVSIVTTPLAIFAGLVAAVLATIGLSLLLDRIVYEPMRDEEGISLLIASIGVALALRYIIVLIWGQSVRGLTAASEVPSLTFTVGATELNFGGHQVALVVIALVLMLGVHLLLQRTKLGKAMRAMADNEDLARVTGIPTERVIKYTWIIGGGLAGAAGYLVVLERGTLSFQVGWLLLLLIFAAVIMGGIGSIYGAMFGGVLLGVAQNIALVWIPSEFSLVATFGIMILVLLFMPSGIFGGKTTA